MKNTTTYLLDYKQIKVKEMRASSFDEIWVVERRRREELLDDGEGGQTLAAHVDHHVDSQIEAEDQVQDAQLRINNYKTS